MTQRYLDFASVQKQIFAQRVQKISINAGFTCPNRTGEKGFGGCTYCNNQSFVPEYCTPKKSVTEQLLEGINFFKHKYQAQKYLAYFQSYTNTYGDFAHLKAVYQEALAVENVVGLVIGTRPDCVSEELLDYLAEISKEKYVMLEFGVESTCEETLRFINRGHTFSEAKTAIFSAAERGLNLGVHLILGLPRESREQILNHAKEISALPISALKLHQLQIIKGTKMAEQFRENPQWFSLFSAEEYIDLVVDFLENLSPKIAIERFVSQSPKEFLLTPDWGLKNFEFTEKIKKRLRERDTFQGKNFTSA